MARRSAVTLCWPASVPVTTRTTRSCFPWISAPWRSTLASAAKARASSRSWWMRTAAWILGLLGPCGTMAGESKVLPILNMMKCVGLGGRWYVLRFFFLCGPIGCPSHSDWVSGWVAAEPLWVSEWLSSCSSHSGRVAEWLLRFLEPCCTSTPTISMIGVGKVKLKDGFARENEHNDWFECWEW